MSKELLLVMEAVANEKGVPRAVIIEAMEAALASAAKKRYHEQDVSVRVAIDPKDGSYETFRRWEVVADDVVMESPERQIRERFAIPVLIRLEPQRLGGQEKIDLNEWRDRLENMLGNGLRATLKSGNLLTGALFVDLNFQRDNADDYEAETFEGRPVIPTTPTGLAQIELKVSNLLDKLNALEVEPILQGMDNTMQQSETLLREIRDLSSSINQLINDPATQQVPANINQTLAELREAIKGLSPDSQAYQELNRTLQSLEKLLRDLQPVARTLGEQPNALIFNPPPANDPQPPAASP